MARDAADRRMFSEDELEALTSRGEAYYVRHLASLLEPRENGKLVAIEPDTGDYEVGSRSGVVSRSLRERHPGAIVYLRRIGPGPDSDLASRMILASLRSTAKP